MTAQSVNPPFPIFNDVDGNPLEDGFIYIGTENLNPETNLISVYWDAALTIPAAQPIRTLGGYLTRAGTPARIYANSNYSITVRNKNGTFIYSSSSVTDLFSADSVNFLQSGTGAVVRTAQSKMRDRVSVLDFMTAAQIADVKAGTTLINMTPAIQAATDYLASVGGGVLLFPPGKYGVDSLTSPGNSGCIILAGDTYSNIVFQGYGISSHIIHRSNSTNDSFGIFTQQGTSAYSLTGVAYYNLRISGFSQTDQIRLIYSANDDNTRVVDNYFDNNSREGVCFGAGGFSSKNTYLRGNHASNVGVTEGVSAYNCNCNDLTIIGNTTDNCGMAVESQGTRNVITGNVFKSSTGLAVVSVLSTYSGVDPGTGEIDSDQVVVSGNIFDNSEGGIANCRGVILSDVDGHSGLNGNAGKVIISGNTFKKFNICYWGGVDPSAISAGSVVIENNYFYDSQTAGNYCITAIKGKHIIQNNVFELGTTSTWAAVIACLPDGVSSFGVIGVDDYHIIKGNTIIGVCWTGFAIYTGHKATITGNIFDLVGVPSPQVTIIWNGHAYNQNSNADIKSPRTTLSLLIQSVIGSYGGLVTPVTGTWKIGDEAYNINPSNNIYTWICTVAGTSDTLAGGVTATTNSTNVITVVTGVANLNVNDWISIATATGGPFQILSIVGTTVTVHTAVTNSVVGQAVSYYAPTWKSVALV